VSDQIELILGNSNPRFSGVTSTMLQVWPDQKDRMQTVVLGDHHLADGMVAVSFWALVRRCFKPLPNGRWRIFHARRNDEMIQALLLKYLFRAKIKIVFTSTAQRYHSGFTKFLMNRMDGLLSTCSQAAHYMHKPPDKLVPHGIDSDTFIPAPDRAAAYAELGLPGKYGIGIFGRVRHQKGVDVLVEACLPILQAQSEYCVVVVGEIGSQDETFVAQLKAKARDAGLAERIVFLGEQDFSRLPFLFSAMTITAALSRNEGFGLTVLEAMSTASAVVASQAGAWPDIVTDGEQGFLVPCGDVEAVREKLVWMMENPDATVEMGRKGRQTVCQQYTIAREAESLCDYFEALAKA